MKSLLTATLLLAAIQTAGACESFGIKGQLSPDNQSIVSRQPIALKEQARQYGGYSEAASVIEENRQQMLRNGQIPATVRHQIDLDLTGNVIQLRCWAKKCSTDNGDHTCSL
ncbi:MAG TPA: hypothetical protein VGC19_08120 [Rhodanobacter sp.]